jgi:hypothetical protein
VASHVTDAHAHGPADHVSSRAGVGLKRVAQSDADEEQREWRQEPQLSGTRWNPELKRLALVITTAVEDRSIATTSRRMCDRRRERR